MREIGSHRNQCSTSEPRRHELTHRYLCPGPHILVQDLPDDISEFRTPVGKSGHLDHNDSGFLTRWAAAEPAFPPRRAARVKEGLALQIFTSASDSGQVDESSVRLSCNLLSLRATPEKDPG